MAAPISPDPPGPSVRPNTTLQEDLVVAGQRRINMIWETTQAVLTILIAIAEIYSVVQKIDAKVMDYAFIAILSTYYARTNHTKTGGVARGDGGR